MHASITRQNIFLHLHAKRFAQKARLNEAKTRNCPNHWDRIGCFYLCDCFLCSFGGLSNGICFGFNDTWHCAPFVSIYSVSRVKIHTRVMAGTHTHTPFMRTTETTLNIFHRTAHKKNPVASWAACGRECLARTPQPQRFVGTRVIQLWNFRKMCVWSLIDFSLCGCVARNMKYARRPVWALRTPVNENDSPKEARGDQRQTVLYNKQYDSRKWQWN